MWSKCCACAPSSHTKQVATSLPLDEGHSPGLDKEGKAGRKKKANADNSPGASPKGKKSRRRSAASDDAEVEEDNEPEEEEEDDDNAPEVETPRQAKKGGRRRSSEEGKRAKADDILTAARKGDLDGIAAALNAGADINMTDSEASTVIMLAVRPPNKGTMKSLEWLFGQKADLDAKDARGRTILHQVVMRGQAKEAAFILEHARWTCEAKDGDGRTPLHLALTTDALFIAEHLLCNLGRHILIETDNNNLGPVQIACMHGALKCLKWLAREQYVDVAALNLRAGGELRRGTPLILAARGGHIWVAQYLVRRRADLNAKDADGMIAEQSARDAQQIDLANYLHAHGSKQPVRLKSTVAELHRACIANTMEKIKTLIGQCRGSLGATDAEGRVATMLCIMEPAVQQDLFGELLRKHQEEDDSNMSSLKQEDNHGRTVLGYALVYGNLPIAKLIIAAKADMVSEIDDAGNGPLHLAGAMMKCSKDMGQWIVKSGGAFLTGLQNNAGQTPLFNACATVVMERNIPYDKTQFGYPGKDVTWVPDPPDAPPSKQRATPIVKAMRNEGLCIKFGVRKDSRFLRFQVEGEPVKNVKAHDEVRDLLLEIEKTDKNVVLTFEDPEPTAKQISTSLEYAQWLIGQSPSVDHRARDRCTALMIALVHGRVDISTALVDASADPHVVDGNDRSLLTHVQMNASLPKEQYDAVINFIRTSTGEEAPAASNNKFRAVAALLKFNAPALNKLAEAKAAAAKKEARNSKKKKTEKAERANDAKIMVDDHGEHFMKIKRRDHTYGAANRVRRNSV